jgi:hypothetical protein
MLWAHAHRGVDLCRLGSCICMSALRWRDAEPKHECVGLKGAGSGLQCTWCTTYSVVCRLSCCVSSVTGGDAPLPTSPACCECSCWTLCVASHTAAHRLSRCVNIVTGGDSPPPRVKPFKYHIQEGDCDVCLLQEADTLQLMHFGLLLVPPPGCRAVSTSLLEAMALCRV